MKWYRGLSTGLMAFTLRLRKTLTYVTSHRMKWPKGRSRNVRAAIFVTVLYNVTRNWPDVQQGLHQNLTDQSMDDKQRHRQWRCCFPNSRPEFDSPLLVDILSILILHYLGIMYYIRFTSLCKIFTYLSILQTLLGAICTIFNAWRSWWSSLWVLQGPPNIDNGAYAIENLLLESWVNILNCEVNIIILTNSMAYGTRRFNAAFTRALQ